MAPHCVYNSTEATLAIANYSRIATANKFLCCIEFCNVLGTFTVGMMRGWRDQICPSAIVGGRRLMLLLKKGAMVSFQIVYKGLFRTLSNIKTERFAKIVNT